MQARQPNPNEPTRQLNPNQPTPTTIRTLTNPTAGSAQQAIYDAVLEATRTRFLVSTDVAFDESTVLTTIGLNGDEPRRSILLFAEPGAGKTHALLRLQQCLLASTSGNPDSSHSVALVTGIGVLAEKIGEVSESKVHKHTLSLTLTLTLTLTLALALILTLTLTLTLTLALILTLTLTLTLIRRHHGTRMGWAGR